MTALVIGFAAVLGLAIGSFLNVVIWRVPRGESIVRPASHCPACQAPIAPLDNVPVLSWLALHGRCRACTAPISPRYPLVEAGTAALFALVAWRTGAHAELPALLYLAAIAVALALIDLDVKRLPDVIVLPSYGVAAILLGTAAAVHHDATPALRAIEAMAACYGGYFALALLYPKGMGFGDVKLAGLLGLYLGFMGWPAVAVGMFSGFLLGGVVGVVLMATRRAGRKSAVPFGPFMLAGAFIGIYAGAQLLHAYLHASGA
ncbi:MAG: prepilin peptidase [Mycobacteriales bacterium]